MQKILLISAAITLAVAVKSQETITIYPDKDAFVQTTTHPNNSSWADSNYGNYSIFRSYEWTYSGYPHQIKSLIDFDLSAIPVNSTITQATLYLYGTGNHMTNLTTGSSTYKSNASYLSRIITPWEESTVTWNSDILTTTTNRVTIPNSSTSDKDYEVDVTNLIKDMITYPGYSHGLMMQLVTESIYTEMRFASSDYTTDTTMRPKLVIEYTQTRNYQIGHGTLNSSSVYHYSNPFYTDLPGSRKQYLLLASELEAAGMVAGDIYSLAINVLNPKTDIESLTLKLGHTSAINLSSSYQSGLSTVFSDAHVPYLGWNTLEFSSAFTWNGTSNIVVELCYDNSSYGSSSNIQFTNTGFNSVRGAIDFSGDGCSITSGTASEIRPNFILKAAKGTIPYHAFTEIGTYTSSPSSAENYVRTAVATEAFGSSVTTILAAPIDPSQVNETIEYFDGLGRPIQSIAVCNSPLGKDLVKPVTYDQYGRKVFDFLPYPAENISSNNGGFRDKSWESTSTTLNPQLGYYQDHFEMATGDPYAYSKTIYEPSPLNRVLAQGTPGESWQPSGTDGLSGHTSRFEYSTNTSSGNNDVRLWNVSGSTVSSTGFYDDEELYKNIIYSEDYDASTNTDAYTVEYKDKRGRVVLKEAFHSSSTILRTYYIYDDFGLLRYVFPPEFSDTFASSSSNQSFTPTTSGIEDFCYYYAYDGRKRMIEKQLPGAKPVYMIYDQLDRLVLKQDGKLRDDLDSTYYLFTLYDYLNRPGVTGQCNHTGNTLSQTRAAIAADVSYYVEEDASSDGYNLANGLPSGFSISEYYTYTYYDSYDFQDNVTGCSTLTFNTSLEIADYVDNDGTSNGYYDHIKGQMTGTRVKVLDDDGTSWVNTAIYYDDRYRIIQTHQSTYPYGTSINSSKYGFIGNILETHEKQTTGTNSTEVSTTFTYDHAQRLLETRMSVDQADPVLIAQNVYNEHGELVEKNLHSDDDESLTQSVDYQYNIRGWLTAINDPEELTLNWDLFGMNLFYDQTAGIPGASPHYNGNISAIQWGKDGTLETSGYVFTYDELNRIKYGNYKTKSGDTWTNPENFDTEYTYDLNGNILTLQRNNDIGESIDLLDYEYDGNQLKLVDDDAEEVEEGENEGFIDKPSVTTEYTYDANGNMLSDANKDINVSYNYLNLPETISTTSTGNSDQISYIYDATGVKWMKITDSGSSLNQKTMYAGSFVYKDCDADANDDFELDYILNAEGKIETTGNTLDEYQYFLKDHLGNTRVVFNEDGEILQESEYYPFGMMFSGALGGDNKYLYNGKELQDDAFDLDGDGETDVNLDWYDYGARFYDPQLGRWHVPDPLSETLQLSFSPYHYCLNNPVLHTDPNGEIVPILAVLGAVAVKAIVGAAIDGGAQYAMGRAQGLTHNQAVDNLDYTSMAASGLISGVTAPGLSTTLRTSVTVTAIAADAVVDVDNGGVATALGVGGANEKPLANVALDAAFSVVGSKSSDAIVTGSKNAVAKDLAPSNYAPLDAAGKQTVKTTESVVNSGAFEQTVNATTSVTVGSVNSAIQSNSGGANPNSYTPTTTTQPDLSVPADNTNIVKPIIF